MMSECLSGLKQKESIEWIVEHDSSLKEYQNSRVFITGATGLIGTQLVKTFLCANHKKNYDIHVIAAVRDEEKAKAVFGNLLKTEQLELYINDIRNPVDYEGEVDFIFHTASITTSKVMVEQPVTTIDTAYEGTKSVLEFARKKSVKKVVYVSSMEVYGNPDESLEMVCEDNLGYIDLKNVRSSYSEGKRICECLCTAYKSQFQVPVTVARLAQTFGPGIQLSDNRVYAQFAKSVINREDIVLHSDGTSEGNYCDIRDVIQALLLLGVAGKNGESYNVANEKSHMQIKEMAHMVADEIAEGSIKVIIDIPESAMTFGYAPKTKMKLSSEKLRKLGWKPQIDLMETYQRMIEDLREEK